MWYKLQSQLGDSYRQQRVLQRPESPTSWIRGDRCLCRSGFASATYANSQYCRVLFLSRSNDIKGMAFADVNPAKACRLCSVASRLIVSMRTSTLVLRQSKLYNRAIAASAFRMALFAETLGTSCTLLPKVSHTHTDFMQDLSHPKLFGLPTTDQLGLESVGIFWSLIETGVAVPVACLPTLRPLFHGLSPESVINSIRSMISLPSIHSQQKKEPRGSYDLKSKTGSFEMASEVPFRHKTGFAEPHRSRDEDPISTNV